MRLFTPGQVLALADAIPRRYALLALIGAGAGLRQVETFGLALDHIDAEAGMITVDQQVIIVERRPVSASRSHCRQCYAAGQRHLRRVSRPAGWV